MEKVNDPEAPESRTPTASVVFLRERKSTENPLCSASAVTRGSLVCPPRVRATDADWTVSFGGQLLRLWICAQPSGMVLPVVTLGRLNVFSSSEKSGNTGKQLQFLHHL